MAEERIVKKLFNNTPEEKRPVGKPGKRWLHNAENYLKNQMLEAGEK